MSTYPENPTWDRVLLSLTKCTESDNSVDKWN